MAPDDFPDSGGARTDTIFSLKLPTEEVFACPCLVHPVLSHAYPVRTLSARENAERLGTISPGGSHWRMCYSHGFTHGLRHARKRGQR